MTEKDIDRMNSEDIILCCYMLNFNTYRYKDKCKKCKNNPICEGIRQFMRDYEVIK